MWLLPLAMDAETIKQIQDAVKVGIEEASKNMISWQMLTLIGSGLGMTIVGIVTGAFKVVWERYTTAMAKVVTLAETKADQADVRVDAAEKRAKEKFDHEMQIRKDTRVECEIDRDFWKNRCLVEQAKMAEEVRGLLGSTQEAMEALERAIPAVIENNNKALDDNNDRIAAAEETNKKISDTLQGIRHAFKKPWRTR